jgi:hypothetical protein
MDNGGINNYNIVVAKNGNITGQFGIKGYNERQNDKTQRKIYNIIANMSRNKAWSRVIIDDYDIIKLPQPTGFIAARFTWFISATDFNACGNNDYAIRDEHKTMKMAVAYNNIDLKRLVSRFYLKKTFNVCNVEKFTEDSISVGKPEFRVYPLVNKNKQYVQMIGAMAGNDAYEIMEMLNGDAIETAAEKAGIKSNSIVDIFKKILEKQYDAYALAVNTLGFIATLDIPGFNTLDDPDEEDVYHQKHVYNQRPIEYNYPGIKTKVLTVKEHCINRKKIAGVAIDRVKDNIKEGDCPICMNPLDGDDTIIMRKCGTIVCSDCGIQGSQLRRDGKTLTGKCPKCRRPIAFTDLIFMNADFDLKSITDVGTTTLIEEKKEVKEVKEVKEENDEELTKIQTLIRIIEGKRAIRHLKKKVGIRGMLAGNRELPDAPNNKRKVIIFSKFNESLNDMEKKMTEACIKFKRLGGTTDQIHAVACEFQDSHDGVNVLLINGEKYASGLNLQTATDLVFMHKIIDRNIEAQIIGRIQRLGRQYKAYVHYILYNEEIPYMSFA